jgi:hypothetical protein
MNNVEVIKIGEILGDINLFIEKKTYIEPIIMIFCYDDNIVNYYLDIFIKNMGEELREKGIKLQKTYFFKKFNIKGIEDSRPNIGKIYLLKSGWHTSRVDKIIDDCIVITKNSIYAIHSISDLRDKKLNKLGIN